MKKLFITVLLLMTTAASPSAGTGGPPCVISPEAMPGSWRPTEKMQQSLSTEPWPASEAEEAAFATRTGVDEMAALYAERPEAAEELWEDSVASLIEVTYASANTPELNTKARDAARRNLARLIQPYLGRSVKSAECAEYGQLLPLAIYAHTRYQENDARIGKMV
ncbi:hypothetical protein HER39_13785, partial [Arthrobacter deserti]|nr:hypothetical protein [Arthrobacter deserti]